MAAWSKVATARRERSGWGGHVGVEPVGHTDALEREESSGPGAALSRGNSI